MPEIEPDYVKLAVGLLAAGFSGLAAHVLTKRRDLDTQTAILNREADVRRRHFRRVVRRCRFRLERIDNNKPEEVWKCYAEMAPEILSEAAFAAGDFRDHDALMKLVTRAGEWRRNDADACARKNGASLREVLRDSIKAIDDFTN